MKWLVAIIIALLLLVGCDPGPQPEGKYQVLFYVESANLENLSRDQQEFLGSLVFRGELKAAGHELLGIFDKDTVGPDNEIPDYLEPWVAAIVSQPLPVMAVQPVNGGTISVFPLPDSEDGVWEKLGGKP